MELWNARSDVVTVGKGFGNGFPVTGALVSERLKENINNYSASSSYGGNPMAGGAALASIEVIEEEGLLEHSPVLGDFYEKRMAATKEAHPITGDVRGKGCLLGIERVKDRDTKEPFTEAGKKIYIRAFRKGWLGCPPVTSCECPHLS